MERTIDVNVRLVPPAGQGLFIYLPCSDALIEGAERGAIVEALAAEYAADAARKLVHDRRIELLAARA